MAGNDKAKNFGNQNQNQQHLGAVVKEEIPDALSPAIPDIEGVETKVQKALANIFDQLAVLNAKTAHLPLARPVFLPSRENHNSDYVAGM